MNPLHEEERSLRLAPGQTLRLRGATGWTVTCRAGVVWVTQEGDSRDRFLSAGECAVLDRPGLVLVSAWPDGRAAVPVEATISLHEASRGRNATMLEMLRRLSAQRSIALLTCLVLSLLLLSGCDAGQRWVIPSGTAWPTALDYWPERRVFLAGSYHDGSIHQVAGDGGPAPAFLTEAPPKGHRRALRLKVDSARNRLWVLDTDAVYAYWLSDGRLQQRVALPPQRRAARTCLPDMALDRATGAVYVSDAGRAMIYRVGSEPGGGALKRADIAVRFEGRPPHPEGFSALAVIESPLTLFAGRAASGDLWRVDPASGQAVALPVPAVKGVCGMAAVVPEGRPYVHRPVQGALLYVSTGLDNRVLRIALTPDFQRSGIAHVAPLMLVDSPVSLVAFSHYVVASGSQLHRHRDFGGDGVALPPFRLALLPTGLESPFVRVRE